MDKNLHRSAFRLHETGGTTQRLNGNESVQSFDLITRWSKFSTVAVPVQLDSCKHLDRACFCTVCVEA